MPKPYRSRARLAMDVLRAIRGESDGGRRAQVTRLLLLANLTHPRLLEHLKALVAKGWVEESERDGHRGWRLTPLGEQGLAQLERIEEAMHDFGFPL